MSTSVVGPLRRRLLLPYVLVLAFALAAFGGAAVFVIDRDLHLSLDERLQTTARASLNFVDVKDGGLEIDARDRRQLFDLLEAETDLAIVRSGSDVVFSTTAKPAALLRLVSRDEGLLDFRQGGTNVRVVVVPISKDGLRIGSVVVWTTVQWIEEADRRVATAFALAALLLAAVASITGASLSRVALDDAFARQRRFTANASHELRAPLSVIRAEADLALRATRDISTYQHAMKTIANESDRMEALVGALLSAARAENVHDKRMIINFQELALRVCERLKPTADAKNLTIALRTAEPCVAVGNSDALESAITAVLHNAIKFSPPDGRIEVWTACNRRRAELFVQDGGRGFSPEALSHALEWFWCDDSARTSGSTGLGLAIAESVTRACGGHVSLGNARAGGALVGLSLPTRRWLPPFKFTHSKNVLCLIVSIAIASLVLATAGVAIAGPPFETDDPEPVDCHHVEVDVAQGRQSEPAVTGPIWEVDYGPARNVEVSIGGQPGETEIGSAIRLIPESKSMPQVGILPALTIADKAEVKAFLPIWAQKTIKDWTIFGGGGVSHGSEFTGLSAIRNLRSGSSLGLEFYHESQHNPIVPSPARIGIGYVYQRGPSHALMFWVGRSLQPRAATFFYVGFQVIISPMRICSSKNVSAP